jgi:ELWxxDGT repeat protein
LHPNFQTGAETVKTFTVDQLEARRLLSTNLVADFNGFYPTDTAEVDGIAYFTANDGVHGRELWKSDGTPGGTKLVRDLTTGSASSHISDLTAVPGGVVFFNVADGKTQLWFSDGTADGTIRLMQVPTGMHVGYVSPRPINNRLVFTLVDDQDGVFLWSTDGTAKRTRQIMTLSTSDERGSYSKAFYAGQRLLFPSELGPMWSTDGTAAGTFQIPPMQSDLPSDMVGLTWDMVNTVELNGELIFSGSFSTQLWRTDGTIEGTQQIAGPGYRLSVKTESNGLIHLFGFGQDQNSHWWVSDGTSAGTHELSSFGRRFYVLDAVALGDKVYVAGRESGESGNPAKVWFWETDGTSDGTKEIDSIDASMATLPAKVGDNKLAVLVYGANDDVQLWAIDLTGGGSTMLKSFGRIGLPQVLAHNNAIYFGAAGKYWKSDGTPEGTVALTGAAVLAQQGLAMVDGRLVVAWDSESFQISSNEVVTTAPPQAVARLKDGILRIYGTPLNDSIRVYQSGDNGDRLAVSINGVKRSFDEAAVKKILIYGYSGDDRIELYERYGAISARSRIWGGSGADTVNGGSGADSIFGDAGDDRITSGNSADVVMAGKGNDSVNGGTGNDTASGDDGVDSLIGGAGDDLLSGGQDNDGDWIDGGNGVDVLFGQAAYDVFFKPQNDGSVADDVLQD